MKLTLAQALATVLNIKQDGERYFINNNGIEVPLSKEFGKALEIAIQHIDLEKECHFAVFPIGSEREGFYMEIERELLRQEAMPHMQGHKAWESFGSDPRHAIEAMMDTAREAARNITVPPIYRTVLLRFACIAVASLQWADWWIKKLTAIAQDPDLGNRILRPTSFQEELTPDNEAALITQVDDAHDAGHLPDRLGGREEQGEKAQEENE